LFLTYDQSQEHENIIWNFEGEKTHFTSIGVIPMLGDGGNDALQYHAIHQSCCPKGQIPRYQLWWNKHNNNQFWCTLYVYFVDGFRRMLMLQNLENEGIFYNLT
jgi:hypothetical protein